MTPEPALLRGHTIYLRQPTNEDVLEGNWHIWFGDPARTQLSGHGAFPPSRAGELDFVQRLRDSRSAIQLAVVAKAGDHLVGCVSLQYIDLIHRTAEVSIMIGELDHRATTTGLEAMGLMTDHAFTRLNLHHVWGGTHERHAGFAHMLGVFGFRMEGRWREHLLRDGRYHDVVNFGVLEREFNAIKQARGGQILCGSVHDLVRETARAARDQGVNGGSASP